MSWSSDDESLAGLTQEPSQKATNVHLESSGDSCDGLFNLLPPEELIDSSANKEEDFGDFVTDIVSDHDEDVNESQVTLSASNAGKTEGECSNVPGKGHIDVADSSNGAKLSRYDSFYCPETEDISDDELLEAATAMEADFSSKSSVKRKSDGGESSRFKVPRTDLEMDEMTKKKVAEATIDKIKWALNVYCRWVDFRRDIFFKRKTFTAARQNCYVHDLEVSMKGDAMLTRDICDFVAEVRKENGTEYPPASIYDLVLMLSLYLEREFGHTCLLNHDKYPDIYNTVSHIMREKCELGLGIAKQKDEITAEQELYLWENGYLGEDTPDKLRLTILFLMGKHFGLRGGKEHRQLVRYPVSQFMISDVNGKQCLIYREFTSKNNQGGIQRWQKRKKEVYAFCTGVPNEDRCLVHLYMKYNDLSPRPCEKFNAFYLRTDPKWQNRKYWYLRLPVGKNQLNDYVKNCMASAKIPGNFSNHSLRATTCTRLFDHNVDEQLICEQTGHASVSVCRYKRTSLKQKENVSKLLDLLPSTSGEGSKSKDGKGVKSSTKNCGKVEANSAGKGTGSDVVVSEDSVAPSANSPINVHVPLPSSVAEIPNMQGLINIHFHFGSK